MGAHLNAPCIQALRLSRPVRSSSYLNAQDHSCYRYAQIDNQPQMYTAPPRLLSLPNPPQSPQTLDWGGDTVPIKPSSNILLFVHHPPSPTHGELALDGVDAVADGGEDDEEDDDDDCDDDVALDHGGGRS